MEMEQETVYGSNEDTHAVMSEKVQTLAGSIYQEFEKMIAKYDEEVVKDLMPLVVNVLECLDLSYTENQEHEVELELLREDNEQLVTQYEREKQLRKSADQKLLEIEDALEDERKDLTEKIESLESIVRMLELKAKNSSDHVYRLEEKEQEMKKEYAKLHERYTELFKTHMDCMERTKILMGTGDRIDVPGKSRMPSIAMSHLNRSSGPVSFGFSSLECSNPLKSMASMGECATIPGSPPDSDQINTNLKNELNAESQDNIQIDEEPSMKEPSEKGWSETLGSISKDNSPDQDLSEDIPPPVQHVTPAGKSHTKREQRSGNTLYQELSFQDAEALGEMDDGADITGGYCELSGQRKHPGMLATVLEGMVEGKNWKKRPRQSYEYQILKDIGCMGKEVENLIMENNELLATKNALNVVKDDLIMKVDELTSEQEMFKDEIKSLQTLKKKLMDRVDELEDEVKRCKEDTEKLAKSNKSDDEEDVPMAQRKRFTRVEMARVLLERNQYKERFMELQEAVRWSEMIRATKNDPSLDKKNKHNPFWRFFGSLFSSSSDSRANAGNVPYQNKDLSLGYVHYNAPTHQISPALETMRKRHINDRRRGFDYFDPNDMSTEKARRAIEKKEQFRQVRAHVSKDDGRLRAYGWSLPGKNAAPNIPPPPSNVSHVPVPVPVYCRPLMEYEPGMKLWCATGVNLSGGRTRDGGDIVGASVFYSHSQSEEENDKLDQSEEVGVMEDPEINKLNEELKYIFRCIQNELPNVQRLSSLVWICTTTKSVSKVTIVDANNPGDILHTFTVCQAHLLCIASVPGATESDYSDNENVTKEEDSQSEEVNIMNGDCDSDRERSPEIEKDLVIGKITFVSCATGSEEPPTDLQEPFSEEESKTLTHFEVTENLLHPHTETEENSVPLRRIIKEIKEGLVKDGLTDLPIDNDVANEEIEKMSSVLSTIWLGAQNGYIFVHSAVSQWRRCLHSIKLKDSVLCIVHVLGKVVCALANGTVAVFRRGPDGQWDLTKYHCVSLGPPPAVAVRCLAAVHSRVWCGYNNKIHVLDPTTLKVLKSIDAHPRRDSQVRQMAWLGDGVWVSIRLDSTLRLYHAHTYEHLQDVDIEPYVSKMLGTGKLGFSFVRITALLISSHRLWIGTGNGVIISVPLSEYAGNSASNLSGRVPGGVVRVFSDPATSEVTPGSFIPYCSMAQAQLSFHGHRDAVKFFVAVPGNGGISAATTVKRENPVIENVSESELLPSMLVISGGEGYIDFRTVDDAEEAQDAAAHLIVWHVLSRYVVLYFISGYGYIFLIIS
ncbi:hypothetical protein PGB90_009037 [Kerria lacca]